MKIISICALIVLTGCQAINKNKDNIKSFAHDVIDEEIDKIDDQKKDKVSKNEMVGDISSFDELYLLHQYGSYTREG